MNQREKNDLVTIGLPTFNSGSRIKKALDSLLAQTYSNFELIISDNCSDDDTGQICREYAGKDKRVRYFRQPQNTGIKYNFEFVFEKATGEYFMWAADDDWWHPEFIQVLKSGLDSDENYGIAMSSLKLVYDDGSPFGEVIFSGRNDLKKMSHGRVFSATIIKKPATHFFVYGLFRIDTLKKLFWQPTLNVYGADKIIICEAALFTRFYSAPDVLWVRTVRRKETPQQYGSEYAIALTDKKAHSKHVLAMIGRLFSSPNIPWHRKLFLLPGKIIFLIWAERKHVMREIFPSGFGALKKLMKRTRSAS